MLRQIAPESFFVSGVDDVRQCHLMDPVTTTHMTTTNTSKPTTHTITLPCGRIATRKSPRIYTHAVVITHGDRYLEQQIRNEEADIGYAQKQVNEYTQVIQTGLIPLNHRGEKSSSTLEDYARWVADYHARIAKNQERIAKHRALIGTGWKEYVVAGWSQSAVNAAKMANANSNPCFEKVEVVEVTRG